MAEFDEGFGGEAECMWRIRNLEGAQDKYRDLMRPATRSRIRHSFDQTIRARCRVSWEHSFLLRLDERRDKGQS
jgi:hypothetical protein